MITDIEETADDVHVYWVVTSDKPSAARANAAYSLGKIGSSAGEVVPTLMKALNAGSNLMRYNSAVALGGISPTNDVARTLVELLENKDAEIEVRKGAARGLRPVGSVISPFIPRILRLLKDRDEHVRSAGIDVLAGTAPASCLAVPTLGDLLATDKSGYVRAWSAVALGNCGGQATVAVPALIRALDSEICVDAAVALGKIGITTEAVKQALQRAAKGNTPCRQRADEALRALARTSH